ncbi:MAG: transcriptional regulator, GntR family [Marmoricola sp.]|nr:transcriptional regulator, GntR family [Marmoricola sp.]
MAEPTDISTTGRTGAGALAHRVYTTVREQIIRGQYPDGARLGEERISAELEVSRIPVREALVRLETDGFVISAPRRSAVVRTWDARSLDELFDVRAVLEPGAARYAARAVARGGSTVALERALTASRDSVRSGDAYLIAERSAAFHEAIVTTTGSDLLMAQMRAISGRIQWLFFRTSTLDVETAFEDHSELAAAIASGDERVAEALTFAHIELDRAPTFAALGLRPNLAAEPSED